MKLTALIAAGALAFSANTAFAGGQSAPMMEAPIPAPAPAPAPRRGSLGAAAPALLALLVIAAATSGGS